MKINRGFQTLLNYSRRVRKYRKIEVYLSTITPPVGIAAVILLFMLNNLHGAIALIVCVGIPLLLAIQWARHRIRRLETKPCPDALFHLVIDELDQSNLDAIALKLMAYYQQKGCITYLKLFAFIQQSLMSTA